MIEQLTQYEPWVQGRSLLANQASRKYLSLSFDLSQILQIVSQARIADWCLKTWTEVHAFSRTQIYM